MTDCFQPCELQYHTTYQTIQEMNLCRVSYHHLPLKEKQRIVEKIHIPQKTICEDVTEHYQFWRDFVNPNKEDCCNLRKTHH